MSTRLLRGPLLAASLAALAACGAGGNTSGSTVEVCRPLTTTTPARPAAWKGTVFTIVMENKSYGDIIGSPSAPYLNQLVKTSAVAAGYHDSYVHPSEPNYIWMVAGENFGILDDADPNASNVITSESHLVDQLERAGLTWKSYQESMGAPCGLTSHGTYAAKHDPFVYFADVNGWDGSKFAPGARCTEHVVDYSQLAVDLASGQVPDYVFITPNLQNDMHDGSIATGDACLAAQVPKLLASDAFKNGGALFILWDEGSSQSDDPPFIAVSPNAKPGFVSQTTYDTSSFLLTVQSMLGVEALPCAAQPGAVSAMNDLFTVPVTAGP
ncbi:MAG TPA: alkaline phosphatase family protein [Polyangia bacterium]|nr:alkaline phosphatase family protein [Polyangia bacterium]